MYPYIHVHTTAGCNLFCLFTEREVDELIEELLNPVSTFTCIHVHAKYRHTCVNVHIHVHLCILYLISNAVNY